LIYGGYVNALSNNTFTIEYVTMASTGNASDFGDLNERLRIRNGGSSTTRGLMMGGMNAAFVRKNQMQYVTIATTGNTIDFGDLTTEHADTNGTSNQHGGLQ
jgi:hypothetical protein